MLIKDLQGEEGVIRLYKETIAVAEAENDIASARIFKKALQPEEEHHGFYKGLLEGMNSSGIRNKQKYF